MTDVIAWPPFQLTGWELAEIYPQSRSVGLIEGRARTSSALRPRRVATAIVTGIGTNMDGAGWVRMLNREWAGKPRLVRVECLSSLWFLANSGLNLQNNVLEWTADGTELLWTAGGDDLLIGDGSYPTSGTPSTVNGYYSLDVVGLPSSRIIARPSDLITVTNGTSMQSGYSMGLVRSTSSGTATIRTDKETPFTVSGLVSIGAREEIVFEALDVPRAVQPVSGTFGFTWNFREVFEDEYADGWTDVDPWSVG